MAHQFETGAVCNPGFLNDVFCVKGVLDTINVGEISGKLRAFLEELGYSDMASYSTDLCASEALTNVVYHGFPYARPNVSELYVLAFQNCVVAVVRDTGNPIPDSVICKASAHMNHLSELVLQELPEGGMGLSFMRMYSQRFYYASGQGVNTLALLIAPAQE
ncbi:MAG: ATP-binding protein [Limnobacter sp.]|nr:ATP-binding protein [Limnobacter sp.]